MSTSALKIREFPALFMTVLFVGAALASTGCLRRMSEPTLPMPSYNYGDVEYFAPQADLKTANSKIAHTASLKTPTANR